MNRPPPPDDELAAFRARLAEDVANDAVAPLEDYIAAFPGDAWAIAREYLAATGTSTPAGDDDGDDAPGAGDRFGDYRIVRELGRGGQAVVFLAVHEPLGREVALKLLLGLGSRSDVVLARFRREAMMASRLDHPGICTVYEAGLHGAIPFIAMRYIAGGSLAGLISETKHDVTPADPISYISLGSFDLDEEADAVREATDAADAKPSSPITGDELTRILRFGEEAARALHEAHEAGVVHRDVKPGNILIDDGGRPVIVDFGLAHGDSDDFDTITRSGEIFGTPAYMSPEQLLAQRLRVDRRTDVYSLGVTLFECLTLRRPFEGPTREALYHAIQTKDPPDPRTLNAAIPRDLVVVLETALEKDRDRRYATAEALADELRRVRLREPIHARPAGPWLRLRRWAQRNPALAAATAMLFLGLVAGLVAALFYLDEKTRLLHAETVARRDAEEQRDLIDRIADATRLDDLVHKADHMIWPAIPDRIPMMREWLDRAADLVATRPAHRATLATIEARGTRDEDGWRFPDVGDAWKHDRLTRFVERLDAFRDGKASPFANVASMNERVAYASTVEQRTLRDVADRWDAAVRAIATSPKYAGLRIEPQLGLIPIGADPASGLWEFVLDASGDEPARGPNGRLQMTADSGIVLVLIPGGSFRMGSQITDPEAPNFTTQETKHELHVHDVRLSPFFLSKYEMTQGQWTRIAHHNPSFWRAGAEHRKTLATPVHPVDSVSWVDCSEMLPRLGLVLPTEAQWEYACRAGTHTAYSTGAADASITGHANIASAEGAEYYPAGWAHVAGLLDGYAIPAPVGTYEPNPFGLHDVHGNVREWCRDRFLPYENAVRPGDGERLGAGPRERYRVFRGGQYDMLPGRARSGYRSGDGPAITNRAWGVRPARPLQ